MRGEQVEDWLQVLDAAQPDLEEIAVLAGDPVALGDVRHLAADPGNQPQPAAGGLILTMAQIV